MRTGRRSTEESHHQVLACLRSSIPELPGLRNVLLTQSRPQISEAMLTQSPHLRDIRNISTWEGVRQDRSLIGDDLLE